VFVFVWLCLFAYYSLLSVFVFVHVCVCASLPVWTPQQPLHTPQTLDSSPEYSAAIDSIVVFRSQLPQINEFYSASDHHVHKRDHKQSPFERECWPGVHLCEVCGVRAQNFCSACKDARYCSRFHQKVHWREGHSQLCNKRILGTTAVSNRTAVRVKVAVASKQAKTHTHTHVQTQTLTKVNNKQTDTTIQIQTQKTQAKHTQTHTPTKAQTHMHKQPHTHTLTHSADPTNHNNDSKTIQIKSVNKTDNKVININGINNKEQKKNKKNTKKKKKCYVTLLRENEIEIDAEDAYLPSYDADNVTEIDTSERCLCVVLFCFLCFFVLFCCCLLHVF